MTVDSPRLRDVVGQFIEEARNIGCALDVRVSAKGDDTAAGTSDIAQQKLQDCGRTNNLRSAGMLREARCIYKGGSSFSSGISSEELRNFNDVRRTATANLSYGFRGVFFELSAQNLEYAFLSSKVGSVFGAPTEPSGFISY